MMGLVHLRLSQKRRRAYHGTSRGAELKRDSEAKLIRIQKHNQNLSWKPGTVYKAHTRTSQDLNIGRQWCCRFFSLRLVSSRILWVNFNTLSSSSEGDHWI